MIFDDHEVTDDWNADKGWLDIIHTPKIRCVLAPHDDRRALRVLDLSGLGQSLAGPVGERPTRQILSAAGRTAAMRFRNCAA